MRKTQRCRETKLEKRGATLAMRTCMLDRGHDDSHLDKHGRWRSTQEQSTSYGSDQEEA